MGATLTATDVASYDLDQGAQPFAWLVALGAALVIGIGVVLGRHADSDGRERAWELEAVGVGVLAAAWLAGTTLGQ